MLSLCTICDISPTHTPVRSGRLVRLARLVRRRPCQPSQEELHVYPDDVWDLDFLFRLEGSAVGGGRRVAVVAAVVCWGSMSLDGLFRSEVPCARGFVWSRHVVLLDIIS